MASSMDDGVPLYGAVENKHGSKIRVEGFNDISSKKKFAKSAALVGTAILFVIGAVNLTSNNFSSINASELFQDNSAQVSFSNEYTAEHGHPAVDYLWVKEGHLVEPYRNTKVQISGITDVDVSKLTASCKATHKQSNLVIESDDEKNTECNMVFTEIGDYVVEASLTHTDLGLIHTSAVNVVSRYVRRDLRKLSETDTAAYLDAARVLYDISTVSGKLIYGENYMDMTNLNEIHLHNAVPDRFHDRLHDGMGFMTQHFALTNQYEMALQAVNPAVALPYWDFTQDLVMIREMAKAEGRNIDYKDLWTLDIWGDDYFGTASGALHTVTTGRWAYTRIPKQTLENKDFEANPYGFMRAPWNLNPSPYLTRFHQLCGNDEGEKGSEYSNQWPSCKIHHYLANDIDNLVQLIYNVAIAGHGGVHLMIGGTGGNCDDWSEMTDLVGPNVVKSMKDYSAFLPRFVYRPEYCTMPSHDKCDEGVHGNTDSCKMYCAGCHEDKFTAKQISTYIDTLDSSLSSKSDFVKEQVVRKVFCETKIILGEQIEASSASDVTFWPIHPTLERLTQYKQLVNPLTDTSWYSKDDFSDFGWSSDGCMWGDMLDVDCTGHGEFDVTVGKTRYYDEVTGAYVMKYLTNRAMFELQMPKNSWKLSYVYDSFDYKHCEKEGIVFKKVPKSDTSN
jgi:hypothetical protein